MVHSIPVGDDIILEYAERGSATGIPVVFLLDVTHSWRSFEPVLDRLPAAIHAFAIAQRSHGHKYLHTSEDLLAFMDVIEIPAAIVVGHSMGSLVAQRFAIDYPSRVAGLVLIGGLLSDGLATLDTPALIVWGDRDTFAAREDQEALSKVIRNSRLVIYSGLGHALHSEDPDRFTADFLDFVYRRQ